jgi:hypothetical protein
MPLESFAVQVDVVCVISVIGVFFERRKMALKMTIHMKSVAEAEAAMYMALFVAAGVPMTLGPISEPGTAGIVRAPGGYYAFESPEPGVIIYQYRRGPCQPVPVPVESPQSQEQSDFMKKMSALTGLTGKALVIYIIISEGSRLFPPRNAVPAP